MPIKTALKNYLDGFKVVHLKPLLYKKSTYPFNKAFIIQWKCSIASLNQLCIAHHPPNPISSKSNITQATNGNDTLRRLRTREPRPPFILHHGRITERFQTHWTQHHVWLNLRRIKLINWWVQPQKIFSRCPRWRFQT